MENENFSEEVPESEMPDDYEACSLCEFDHEYEPVEAQEWHRDHPYCINCLRERHLCECECNSKELGSGVFDKVN